ncbi:programmed cell death 1 ligand 1-like isoform X1 [Bufo bufo]|uniref:programmed cell death 1 ligand 1-like isoform X1 n=1 Tax=Bufo bufo TaxID=8384 RepID=UPI001ABE6573|nr:programmed cell death 1 ligand 1-like isoform X1 [Bufo bufo]
MLFIQLFLFILLDYNPILGLFVVTAPKSTYTVKRGDTIQMICNFPVPKEDDLNKLQVSWQQFQTKHHGTRQVTMFNQGREDELSQDTMYKGRASLVTQALKNGMAILQIEDVKLTDAGTYLCVLQLGGSDYKEMSLNVQASYSKIANYSEVSEDNQISFTCESSGFPEAEVYWKENGVNVSSLVTTSHTQIEDGLYIVTSTIKGIDMNHLYHCVFWNKALKEETEASLKYSGHLELLNDGSNYNRYPQRNESGHHRLPSHTVIIISIIMCVVVSLVVMVMVLLKKRHLCFKCFKKKGDRSSPL